MGKFEIKVTGHFCASLMIHGDPGVCGQVHGHNYQVGIKVLFIKLNELGFGVDYMLLKEKLNGLCERLDHCHLNDLADFSDVNPTAEHIARWFYHQLAPWCQQAYDAHLQSVEVQDLPGVAITYYGE